MKTAFVALFAAIVGTASIQPSSAADSGKARETVLHSFGGGLDGQYPSSSLVEVNGTLYGTTAAGGSTGCDGSGCGTVFSVDPDTGAETVLYSFCTQRHCADGAGPSGLVDVNGILYGTTELGGQGARCRYKEGCGTVFSLDPATGAETVLYSFCSRSHCRDGWMSNEGLIAVNGSLYGTTFLGGTSDAGTVFSLNPVTGAQKVLHYFCSQENCADGTNPLAGLVALKGTLYGVTTGAGNSGCRHFSEGCGILFSLDPKTGLETPLYAFCSQPNCKDGGNPAASLIVVNGTLYGTTYDGGVAGCVIDGCGTVFSFDPSTGTETVLHAFCRQQDCPDGALPLAGVIDVDGTLYGTTAYGGRTGCPQTGDCGTVFSLDPATGTETVLHAFCSLKNCTDGWAPQAGLIAVNGTFYGTTTEGGADDDGVVFAIGQKRQAQGRKR